MKTLALLHTTAVTVSSLAPVAKEALPGVRIVNLLDDSLLEDVMTAGHVTHAVEARIAAYVAQAAALGADGVLCCCSSIGEAAERVATGSTFPVWRIDAAMADEAARIASQAGGRIGVLATVKTTLEPTARLVERACGARGASVEPVLVDGAFARLRAGDAEGHDALVRAALEALAARSDVIVLAQASMARVVATLAKAPLVPVLASPPLAFARMREVLLKGSGT